MARGCMKGANLWAATKRATREKKVTIRWHFVDVKFIAKRCTRTNEYSVGSHRMASTRPANLQRVCSMLTGKDDHSAVFVECVCGDGWRLKTIKRRTLNAERKKPEWMSRAKMLRCSDPERLRAINRTNSARSEMRCSKLEARSTNMRQNRMQINCLFEGHKTAHDWGLIKNCRQIIVWII